MGLGSGIRDPEKTYSGSRIQGSKRHRIPDPDPQHCFASFISSFERLDLETDLRMGICRLYWSFNEFRYLTESDSAKFLSAFWQCFGSVFADSGSGSSLLLNTDPIRIQSEIFCDKIC
jgi:hypothetical protein